jgi:hypothetical protein
MPCIYACNRNKKVDVSNIPVDVKIERFDQDFDLPCVQNRMDDKPHSCAAKQIRRVLQDFIERIIKIGSTARYQLL